MFIRGRRIIEQVRYMYHYIYVWQPCFMLFIIFSVVITAVNKASTPLQLHYFSNCFHNKYSDGEMLPLKSVFPFKNFLSIVIKLSL